MPLPEGIYYPVITPFTNEYDIDDDILSQLIDFGVQRGISGVFALGSSGQGPAMHPRQRKEALEIIIEAVDSQVPVIAHIGTPVAATSLDLARHAADAGADMLALLPPYFYSDHSEYELMAHYERVADEADRDIMIYNNPKYAGTDLSPSQVKDLTREVPSVTGIKASFTSVSTLLDYVEQTPDNFDVFAGSIGLLFPARYHGVAGSIHPPSSVFPEIATAFWEAIEDKQIEDVVQYQRLLHDVSTVVQKYASEYGRAVYVSLFSLRGIDIDRYPFWEHKSVPRSARSDIKSDLLDLGLSEEGIRLE